ncbi:hypothetical protein EV175_005129, partial [Coemansia sp. RSA 1933]
MSKATKLDLIDVTELEELEDNAGIEFAGLAQYLQHGLQINALVANVCEQSHESELVNNLIREYGKVFQDLPEG